MTLSNSSELMSATVTAATATATTKPSLKRGASEAFINTDDVVKDEKESIVDEGIVEEKRSKLHDDATTNGVEPAATPTTPETKHSPLEPSIPIPTTQQSQQQS